MKLLFLQLPRLDHDTTSPGENTMLAAACLTAALERSPEGKHWTLLPTPPEQETGSDQALRHAILKAEPDVIAATCTLWNIERTLDLLKQARQKLPHLKVVLGGPEIAEDHPLLRKTVADALCIGEGEPHFPAIVHHLRTSPAKSRREKPVFYRASDAKPLRLADALPPPDHPINKPDVFGMAYLETNRGCPMKCAFCCYNLRRSATTCLEPEEVAERIRILRKRGAKEIRLVDPTFNAHPHFEEMLKMMRRINRDKKIAFFVEIRADTLTEEQAKLMAEAHITEAEVGVQSTDPKVLKIIHRPLNEQKVFRGIEALLRHNIKPTVDFMYALPAQDAEDMKRSLAWLARFGEAIHPQFLPTLLLPGTELRDRAKELGLRAQKLPPYRVLSTDRLTSKQLAEIEQAATETLGGFDSPTPRFVGKRLEGLFNPRGKTQGTKGSGFHLRKYDSGGQVRVQEDNCRNNRTALFFDFSYETFSEIIEAIKKGVAREPHILWQFVVTINEEIPLDFIENLIAVIRRLPAHWLDRLVSPLDHPKRVARRLFIKLSPAASISASWKTEAEAMLRNAFH
jgi:radical SAM superfamily enzyme YgiQ (UPF0313 family)